MKYEVADKTKTNVKIGDIITYYDVYDDDCDDELNGIVIGYIHWEEEVNLDVINENFERVNVSVNFNNGMGQYTDVEVIGHDKKLIPLFKEAWKKARKARKALYKYLEDDYYEDY